MIHFEWLLNVGAYQDGSGGGYLQVTTDVSKRDMGTSCLSTCLLFYSKRKRLMFGVLKLGKNGKQQN